VAAACFGPGCE
jgi:hypothetical protein